MLPECAAGALCTNTVCTVLDNIRKYSRNVEVEGTLIGADEDRKGGSS